MSGHNLEFNKVAAAVLLAGIIALVSGLVAQGLYTGSIAEHEHEAKRGFTIAGAESAAPGAPAAEEEKPVDIAPLMAKADAKAGELVVKKCTSCHTFDKGGKNGVGPNQWGLVGASFGHKEDFAYSDAVKSLHGKKTWTPQELSDFLANPKKHLPGNKMSFAGIKNPADRANLIAYLSTLKINAMRKLGALFFLLAGASPAVAAPSYCLPFYGECKYKAGFDHFDYVNPRAPKGGSVKLAETGTFDNLNMLILKGVKAPAMGQIYDALMVQSQDEPETMYGLVAESVDVTKDNSSASFIMRKEARFHDGSPITPEDVVFSFNTIKEKGDPTYRIIYGPIAKVEKTGERQVTFTFSDPANKELPIMAASMPILSKAYYEKVDFEKTTLESPLGSGPYKVATVDQGRTIIFKRVADYWGKDLPVNRGQYNFDEIRYDMYRDENVALEGLKAGEYDFRREYIARSWATAYDSPAIKDGRIIKREIPDGTPQGMQAFIYNTRLAKFSDRRVREALGLAFDYEWVNKTIFYGVYARNRSFFENTDFEATALPAGRELALLKPFENELPPELFTQPFENPKTDGSGNPRENLKKADALLTAAGWVVKEGIRVNDKGEQLSLEFMLRQPTMERAIAPMRKNLERLGITSSIRMVDDAQYQKRTDSYDFEMVSVWINRGVFFPGNEQVSLWQSAQADVKGGNNLAGTKSKVIDTLLAELISAKDKDSLIAAGRALDRVLLWEHVVIPNWHSNSFRVAYASKFGLPDITPKYNLGFQTWWVKPAEKK